jgi:hypothetical protein
MMPVPEQLVTIRAYDSPDLAAEDHQALLDAGINAYVSGTSHHHTARTELRVPESEAEAALELLPDEEPSLADLMAPSQQCIMCGSTLVQEDSPAMRWVLVIGGAVVLWVLYRGAVNLAIMLLLAVVTLAAGVRVKFHYRKCGACGHEWHRSDRGPET